MFVSHLADKRTVIYLAGETFYAMFVYMMPARFYCASFSRRECTCPKAKLAKAIRVLYTARLVVLLLLLLLMALTLILMETCQLSAFALELARRGVLLSAAACVGTIVLIAAAGSIKSYRIATTGRPIRTLGSGRSLPCRTDKAPGALQPVSAAYFVSIPIRFSDYRITHYRARYRQIVPDWPVSGALSLTFHNTFGSSSGQST